MGLRHGPCASAPNPPVSSQKWPHSDRKCELTGRGRARPCDLSPHPRPSRPRPQPARAVAETAASLSTPGGSFRRPGDRGINYLKDGDREGGGEGLAGWDEGQLGAVGEERVG